MSKIVPLLFAGTGAAAVSVGGAYLIKNGGSGPSDQGRRNNAATVGNSQEKQVFTFEFDDINAFKNASVANVECVKDFTGLDNLQGGSATEISQSNKVEGSFIVTSDGATTAKGCLIVNWDKKEYDSSK